MSVLSTIIKSLDGNIVRIIGYNEHDEKDNINEVRIIRISDVADGEVYSLLSNGEPCAWLNRTISEIISRSKKIEVYKVCDETHVLVASIEDAER